MKIVVIGGTGLVGTHLMEYLAGRGHRAVAAARSTGVDISTGQGLPEVLDGAEAVIDVSNSGYRDAPGMEAFFTLAGANLMRAERAGDIRHHVVLSAIGVDRFDSGFFRAKRRQEEIVAEAGIPFTIVRLAPVFEYHELQRKPSPDAAGCAKSGEERGCVLIGGCGMMLAARLLGQPLTSHKRPHRCFGCSPSARMCVVEHRANPLAYPSSGFRLGHVQTPAIAAMISPAATVPTCFRPSEGKT